MVEMLSLDRASFRFRILMLIAVVLTLLFSGMVFYHQVEEWSYIDSFYFSAISLSTRGYGELHPSTVGSKLFTVSYLFLGVGFILYLMSSCISYFLQFQEGRVRKRVDSIVNTFVPNKKEKWVVLKPSEKKEGLDSLKGIQSRK
ncbi:MAG: potassium channel family protein [Candidatus Woesearchaeota archaeon]